MKVKQLIMTSALLVAISLVGTSRVLALTSAEAKAIKTAVTSVSVPEMPAKAAELVSKAEKADREAVAVIAVRSIVLRNKSAAPVVVSAIIKVAPEVAVAVTANAVELAGEQEAVIVRAASMSAPDQARQIAAFAKKSSQLAQNSVSEAGFAQNSGIVKSARVRGVAPEPIVRGLASGDGSVGNTELLDTTITGDAFPNTAPAPAPTPSKYNKVNPDVQPVP